jgi:hypothetical protein
MPHASSPEVDGGVRPGVALVADQSGVDDPDTVFRLPLRRDPARGSADLSTDY